MPKDMAEKFRLECMLRMTLKAVPKVFFALEHSTLQQHFKPIKGGRLLRQFYLTPREKGES